MVLLRVARAYRTVSAEAVQVIASTLLISLMVRERAERENLNKEMRTPAEKAHLPSQEIYDGMAGLMGEARGQGCMDQMPYPGCGEVDREEGKGVELLHNHFPRGHGFFRTSTNRIGKYVSLGCPNCEEEEDTPSHTVFCCPRWALDRDDLGALGKPLQENFMERMVSSMEGWT